VNVSVALGSARYGWDRHIWDLPATWVAGWSSARSEPTLSEMITQSHYADEYRRFAENGMADAGSLPVCIQCNVLVTDSFLLSSDSRLAYPTIPKDSSFFHHLEHCLLASILHHLYDTVHVRQVQASIPRTC
jgi:hypothetical protein